MSNLKRFQKVLIVCIIVLFIIFTSGCIIDNTPKKYHDEEDNITAKYVTGGHYYYEDDNGRSFNKTLWEGDVSQAVKGHTATSWILYVHNLKFVDDFNGSEIFQNVTETMERGAGDCEDLSILMARGLYELGYDTCVIVQKEHVLTGIHNKQAQYLNSWYSKNKNTFKHVFVDDTYKVLETTANWGIGEYDEKPVNYGLCS